MTDIADKIESIKRLTLGPDDALIVSIAARAVDRETLFEVKRYVQSQLGDHVRVLVHGSGIELSVLNIVALSEPDIAAKVQAQLRETA